RDELQSRRREDGAEGRRARFSEIQGHRKLIPGSRMTMRIGERRVALDDLVRVARGGETGALAASASGRIRKARALVEKPAASSAGIYGVNSALGANTGAPLASDDIAAYQTRAIRARAVAVGVPYDRESVRAMLFARIAGMAAGGSGASLDVVDALCALVNR